MDIIDDIEKGFDLVNDITFMVSPFRDNNNWVALVVRDSKNTDIVIKSYTDLQGKFKEGKRMMVLYEGQYQMKISLINEKTRDIVNIAKKRFNYDQFNKMTFLDNEKIDLRIETPDLINHIKGRLLDFTVVTKKL
jgi:hypothetical protein